MLQAETCPTSQMAYYPKDVLDGIKRYLIFLW